MDIYGLHMGSPLGKKMPPEKIALLKETDVLVDGPFLLAERSLELRFCGSRNQRLIDVKKSLAEDQGGSLGGTELFLR